MVERDPGEVVADTSIIGRVILREEGWKLALEALLETRIHVVDFQISEIGNLLWKRRDLTIKEATERYKEALLFTDEIHPTAEVFEEALKISKQYNLPFYDSEIIALAKKLSLPLYSADRLQAEISRKNGLKVVFFE